MRKPPPTEVPPVQSYQALATNNQVTLTRVYDVITPLMGGGVQPNTADPITLIRGPSVRGQLRFWWRACYGGTPNDDAELLQCYDEKARQRYLLHSMREREGRLWGWAAGQKADPATGPSQVLITIEVLKMGQAKKPFLIEPKNNGWKLKPDQNVAPSYAAFPLQPPSAEVDRHGPNTPIPTVQCGVQFKLTLRCPAALQAEVEAALWAWDTFGGIGARTRRGFGALQRNYRHPDDDGAGAQLRNLTDLQRMLKKHVRGGIWPEQVPHLAPDMRVLLCCRRNDVHTSWRCIIKELHAFRQHRSAEMPSGQRSDWPEADEIRRLWHDTFGGSPPKVEHPGTGFPRAAFGLPIIFHFNSTPPEDTTLQGSECDRWASPLILRPLLLSCGPAALAAILENSRLPDLKLVTTKGDQKYDLDTKMVSDLESASVGAFINTNVDNALDAFWEQLKKQCSD